MERERWDLNRKYALSCANLARLKKRDQARKIVLALLQEKPRMDYREVAEALGWPLKKTKGHMDRMQKDGLIELVHQWQVKSIEQ